ncbi:MAG TPA: hypothetical protein VMU14_24850 [Acidimicrobiales bacterium]|nr:hypothetical protein [Acidimicrobiales bacterium]
MAENAPKDPFTDDVKRDEAAAKEAARRMGATGDNRGSDPDPDDAHDPQALEDAAERMGAGGESKKP